MNPHDLWSIINRQDEGDLELIATLPPLPIDELISVAYPAMLLRLAADNVGIDNDLAWRLVARARAVASYKWKQDRLRRLYESKE